MNLITCKKFKGGGDSLKFRVGSCEFLSGGRVSSRAVGGSSSSWRLRGLFSLILLIALLFGASGAWAAQRYWIGAGDTIWNNKANWEGGNGSGYLRIEFGTYPISSGIRIGENATYHGEITVTGGAVLKAKDGNKGKTSTVLFNGGTLKANGVFSTSWPAIIADKAKITVNVGANGGTIDSSGFNIQVARPIAADGDNDGVHPNDWGMVSLAKAYGNAVK